MTLFSVNTHHAYLNTKVTLTNLCKGLCITVKDSNTNGNYILDQSDITLYLSAGNHKLTASYNGVEQVEYVVVEDAIKLGGSQLKAGFISDFTPYVFVIMKDRLYWYNRTTSEEGLEYNLVPEKITYLGNSHFLFKTGIDFSVFDCDSRTVIAYAQNVIYSNEKYLITEEPTSDNLDRIGLLNFANGNKVVSEYIESKYSIWNNHIYYIKDNQILDLDLATDNTSELGIKLPNNEKVVLIEQYAFGIDGRYDYQNRYFLFDMEIKKKMNFYFPYFIANIKDIEYYNIEESANEFDLLFDSNSSLLKRNISIELSFRFVKIIKIVKEAEKYILLASEWDRLPNKKNRLQRYLQLDLSTSIPYHNVKEVDPPSNQNKYHREQPFDKKQFAKSESGNLFLEERDGIIIEHCITTKEEKKVLTSLYNNDRYSNAYFTNDGNNIIIQKYDKSLETFGFGNLSTEKFEVKGFTIESRPHINGYNAILEIKSGRLPVWRDPISLQWLGESSSSKFVSPNNRYIAQNNKSVIAINILTNEEFDLRQASELKRLVNYRKQFEWTMSGSQSEKEIKIQRRRDLVEKYGKDAICKHLREYYMWLISLNQKLSEEDKAKRIEELIDKDLEDYILNKENFCELFIDPLGYVIFTDTNTSEEFRLLIGRNTWYLNYVSFSYDSRYMSFGAKMKEDSFRHSQAGVFVIYDLIEQKTVLRLDEESGLHAVWMTTFNKEGKVAFYDSHANAYILSPEDNYQKSEKAAGKSLLCFSPSGKYIAFSDQNYITRDKPNGGHQPSGNIYIHNVNDLHGLSWRFSDFGEGILGASPSTRRANSVASVAFSADDKRLLAVGDDGVIVIRNLHLNKYCKEKVEDNTKLEENKIIIHGEVIGNDEYEKSVLSLSTMAEELPF